MTAKKYVRVRQNYSPMPTHAHAGEDDEIIEWDFRIEPPPCKTYRIRARLNYIGRDKPIPIDEDDFTE